MRCEYLTLLGTKNSQKQTNTISGNWWKCIVVPMEPPGTTTVPNNIYLSILNYFDTYNSCGTREWTVGAHVAFAVMKHSSCWNSLECGEECVESRGRHQPHIWSAGGINWIWYRRRVLSWQWNNRRSIFCSSWDVFDCFCDQWCRYWFIKFVYDI